MSLGEEIILIHNWARLHFIQNDGMAFGLELGGKAGKLVLSLFRIAAVIFLGFLLRSFIRQKATNGLLISFSLILAGAMGNILDSAFYGLIFNDPLHGVATLFPPEGGYAGFLFGKVVDMFYFPMLNTTLPEWLPLWGGNDFQFFRPVFNLADSYITVGVACILLFYRKYFGQNEVGLNKQRTALAAEENV